MNGVLNPVILRKKEGERYALGKKIPTNMDLDAETFLDEMYEKIYSARHPD